MTLQLRWLCPLLQVFDMPTSLAFYRDILGLEIVQAAPPPEQVGKDEFDWVWLRRDDAHLMLNTAYDPDAVRPPAPDPSRVAAHDDIGLFIGCPDVDGMYEHLRGKGLVIDPPTIAPYGMKQLYLKDPDGFTLCFQWAVDAPAATRA
ncbi:MAG TPA: VOC family protein [Gemmatimonadaceae bacterium]|nr:VOC family protein [Gemmatimonadaceae bacterium]